MIPPHVRYLTFPDLGSACAALAAERKYVALGGGTVVVPELVRRERHADAMVELRGLVPDGVTVGEGEVEFGALATYTTVARDPRLQEAAPLLRQLAAGITGGAQLRNQATLVGSACRAIPSSDVPAALVGLDATMRVQGPSSSRDIAATDFFLGAFRTALAPGEIVRSVVVPSHPGGYGYLKFKFSESSWPIVTAAAFVRDGASPGGPRWATIGVGGLAPVPARVDLDLDGSLPTAADLNDLLAEQTSAYWSDELADGNYRRSIAGAIARRALAQAATRHQDSATDRGGE
ncbi:FAD binding domain-containing protein [Pseudonocardia ailaonensis]|uniref:FAD binding domain-containing protein n=1 Tax=Pseudonocardia ailaonensis TaxID=367279 RepID=A0ABN2NBF9_9PSEU